MKAFTVVLAAIIVITVAGSAISQTAPGSQPSKTAQPNTTSAAKESSSTIDPAKENDIRRLMEITDVSGLAVQTMQQMTSTMKSTLRSALPPGEYREKLIELFFAKFMAKADGQQIVELAIPVYEKHFSREEIKGLIQFYQTPLGRKALTELPLLVTELRNAGQEWGRKLGTDSMQEVLAEHPDLLEAMNKAEKHE